MSIRLSQTRLRIILVTALLFASAIAVAAPIGIEECARVGVHSL